MSFTDNNHYKKNFLKNHTFKEIEFVKYASTYVGSNYRR